MDEGAYCDTARFANRDLVIDRDDERVGVNSCRGVLRGTYAYTLIMITMEFGCFFARFSSQRNSFCLYLVLVAGYTSSHEH
jgi:hypothetical protein